MLRLFSFPLTGCAVGSVVVIASVRATVTELATARNSSAPAKEVTS